MRNPLTRSWRAPAQGEIVMAGSEGVVVLIYRNPTTGEAVQWACPIPCSPALMRTIEQAFAQKGFVRVDDAAS